MSRCPSCDYPLPGDRERLGARCPNCRDPLYEPPGRMGRPARDGEGSCALHAGVETVGVCARCGNYLCEVCRTEWRGQIVCGDCAQRGLESKDATPEASRQQFRQALTSLGFGVGAWVLTLGGSLTAALGTVMGNAAGQLSVMMAGLGIIAVAVVLAVAGVGNATAVLRVRGGSMILAVVGLLLCSLQVGALIGLFVASLHN